MSEYSIRDKCKVNTNFETDTFVGIRCDKGEFSVHFPLGYRLSDDDKELRRDIIGLLNMIGMTVGRKDSEIDGEGLRFVDTGFPIQSYLSVIRDFYERGYYREQEVEYTVSKRGKINWSRTIKTQEPVIQGNEVYYLNFVTKRNSINDNELITLIHEYCVYESFEKIGWLFTAFMPGKPRIKYNRKLFIGVVKDKLSRTFNDKNKNLFISMLRILEQTNDNDSDRDYLYGTYRFEYVWEAIIDRVFGVEDKAKYFPKTTWHINGSDYENASLEPDTIMLYKGDVYVLDAKYYKYGATKRLADLPESTSINKQITYGEYVANNMGIKGEIYNAFIMPFDSKNTKWKANNLLAIGDATGDWRSNDRVYEHIQGILIDVKYLMNITVQNDSTEIASLASCISNAVNGE